MAEVIRFEDRALKALRDRLGAAEVERDELLAFARGHAGATASIHEAVLSLMACDSVPDLFATIVHRWAELLLVDHCAIALKAGEDAYRIDRTGNHRLESAWVTRAMGWGRVQMRATNHGDPLFGKIAPAIRTEALIPFEAGDGRLSGLILLGQEDSLPLDGDHGQALLGFLGETLGAMLMRCTKNR
ncbi:DUF484 family protein [Sphingomicrobium sediminis]|uniref:DUF484 family protein n=1 Tax=Sphingomicrobium sediminis TaxID=2950949 RepID=A0A9X2EKU3_9SPHN|nr:DUF484 family protein [Sphingomicrobium sediminis]MCM8557189.1 DUF484 family protein [Sphingomicrobium sediminis]